MVVTPSEPCASNLRDLFARLVAVTFRLACDSVASVDIRLSWNRKSLSVLAFSCWVWFTIKSNWFSSDSASINELFNKSIVCEYGTSLEK